MIEKEFWQHLESRVCDEIAGLAGDEFLGWCCKSFVAERIGLVGDRAAVIGRVSMFQNENQFAWHFALLLKSPAENFDDIDWGSLLPPKDITGWLSMNRLKKEMKIDLQAGYPDVRVD